MDGRRGTRFDFNNLGDDPAPESQPALIGGSLRHSPFKRQTGRAVASKVTLKAIPEDPVHPLPGCELLCNVWLGKTQFVVAQGTEDSQLMLLQNLAKTDIQEFLKTSHTNIVKVVDTFKLTINSHEKQFVGWEFMQMSLLQVTKHHLLNDARLASVLGQVLNGLNYLQSMNMEHGQLSCATVLINYDGVVKIGGLEHCKRKTPAKNSVGFKQLARELVDFTRNDTSGNYTLASLPLTPPAVAFIEFIDKAPVTAMLEDVLRHNFLRGQPKPAVLRGMLSHIHYFMGWRAKWQPSLEMLTDTEGKRESK